MVPFLFTALIPSREKIIVPKAKGISSHFPINFLSEIEPRSVILSYSINDIAVKVDKLASVDNGEMYFN